MKNKKKSTYELRNFQELTATQEEELKIVEGYAVVFNSPTVLYEDEEMKYVEVINERALDNTDLSNVKLLVEHGAVPMPLATTRNGTLEFLIDEKGLNHRAKLINTTLQNEIYELVKNGYYDEMSFGFKVRADKITSTVENGKETIIREITDIEKIREISIVNFGAYQETIIEARDAFSVFEEKSEEIKEKRKEEKARQEAIQQIEDIIKKKS
jgi:uncharacterized protein